MATRFKYINNSASNGIFNDLEREYTELKNIKFAYTTKSFVGSEVSDEGIKAVLDTVEYVRKQGFTVEEVDPEVDGMSYLAGYFTMNAAEQRKSFIAIEEALGRPIKRGEVVIMHLHLASLVKKYLPGNIHLYLIVGIN